MKNKIIAMALTLTLALSSTTVFAAGMESYPTYDWSFINNLFASEPWNTQSVEPLEDTTQTETPSIENTQQANTFSDNTQLTEQENIQTNNTTAPTSKSNYEQKVVELVNVERQKVGLPSLSFDSAISNVARAKSKDMADNNYFAHQSPTYGSAGDMLKQNGINYSAWGENIAKGQRSPEEVVNAWMNSEGHKANILSPNFSKLGVGYVTNSTGTPYWTQMFTN
ncbi:CAP domain-containing protein [Sedimentibacter sp. MB31-C6]|uniref:CAP domain-containing protein n=1 Tax=Sedimentibacter sp. MB31-C6 TaxID=3109366 RepID=UPI002DDDBA99|nr:CAP domain-containing protein [Sedimentibacter sp. MB36-C1]WSI05182.1 CAP domain-containing protein [Sedimentibacter sp. MB36-C1]